MFDPDSITQNKLQAFRDAAQHAWDEDTRHPDFRGHPCPAQGQCYVTAQWLTKKLGGHIGYKAGHYFWVSPDKQYVIDLTGEQNAYEPHKGNVILQDQEDEPYSMPEDHKRWRPGPVIYTRASHPLYKGFRVKTYPDHPRATLFAKRADAALEGGLQKTADPSGGGGAGGFGGDAYPGQEPQADEDFYNQYGDKHFHDTLSDLQLSLEETPNNEYRWFYGNGQLHVSPIHSHGELRDHSGVSANFSGPIAAGFVHVQNGNAIWSAESNIAIRGLAKELQDYSKAVGWQWGGLVGGDGQPFLDDLGPKKSLWYGWQDGVQISEHPFSGTYGRFACVGHIAYLPGGPGRVREGLEEWASDFGYRIAEYPGGGDMTDKVKSKEWPMQFDKGNPDKPEPEPTFEDVPKGELTCPTCGETLPSYMEFVVHMDNHQGHPAEHEDGHFPTIEDRSTPLPLRLRHNQPTAQPLASVREASLVPDFDLYSKLWGFAKPEYRFYGGYLGGQLVGYGVVDPGEEESTIIMIHSAVPGKGVGTVIGRKIMQHYPNVRSGAASKDGERLMARLGMMEVAKGLWRYSQGSEGKDLLQAPVPFVYDIRQDKIYTGHPGQRSTEVPGQFTPGGIAEGYYQPGGKLIIHTTTSMPYSAYHLVQLWYATHPHMEVTNVELENQQGKPRKLAAQDVGSYIKTLAATDPAVWKAYQALRQAGGHVYVVGGAVRDALLQKEPKDIDLMVSGISPETVQHVLGSLRGSTNLTGKRFGVYRYSTKGNEVEIALPRTDDYGEGGRRGRGKITVDHTLPIEHDLARRDFTGNSMAVSLETGQLIDPYGGAQDIAARRLRATHDCSFEEDPTRLVRAITALSRFGLSPDEDTRKAMAESSHRLEHESPDALKQQLDKLLVSPNPAGALRLAHETGVLRYLFPELDTNFDYDQHNPHHNFTLGEHTLQVLDHLQDPHLRLAAIFHDLGKPASAWEDPRTGNYHFYAGQVNGKPVGADHAAVGANLMEARMRKTYNYPVADMRRVHDIVSQHMFSDFTTPKGARRFLNKAGQNANDLLTFREADRDSKGGVPMDENGVSHMRNLVEQARGAGVPTDQTGLSLNGHDLINMGLKAGPQVGTVLRQLTNDVLDEPQLNERPALEQRAQEYINAQP